MKKALFIITICLFSLCTGPTGPAGENGRDGVSPEVTIITDTLPDGDMGHWDIKLPEITFKCVDCRTRKTFSDKYLWMTPEYYYDENIVRIMRGNNAEPGNEYKITLY